MPLRAPQQSASTPLQHKFLIYHPTTTTMPRVKARAAKDEERETKIRQALEERGKFNASFEDLYHKYGVPKSTLCDRARSAQSCQKVHKDYQALTPSTEDALEKWTLQMGSQGAPPRLDLFKATTEKLFQQQLRDEPNATMITWAKLD